MTSHFLIKIGVFLVLFVGLSVGMRRAVGAEPAGAAPADVSSLPSIKDLPDPFAFNDGSKVKSREEWPKRRAEISELVQKYEYGHLPPKLPVKGEEVATKKIESSGAAEKQILLTIGENDKSLKVHLRLSMPQGKGPFPVIVRGDQGWGYVDDKIRDEVTGRGYMLVEFNREEIVPDKRDAGKVLLYAIYPDGDFGALAAWAWGYHRVIDYLVTLDSVDKAHIAITGHSRGGKTVLFAGATDERIALTAPNNSGCGGAGCYRYQAGKSEDIAAILKNFPFWFQPNFGAFIGKIDRLPIDQHEVKALVAPRALLSTEGLGDEWANPEGTEVTYLAAREVYKFLGAEDKIGIYFRTGGHEHGYNDWVRLLDFADKVFFGKEAKEAYDRLAFPNPPKPYEWAAPGTDK